MAGKKRTITSYTSWPKPVWATVVKTNKNFKSNYQGAMMYAHYELSSAELKKEVIKYLRTLDAKHALLDRIKDIDEARFGTIGKYMFVLNNAGDIPDDIMVGLIPALENTIEEEEIRLAEKKKNAPKVVDGELRDAISPIPTIQDRLREKTREIAGEVEGWIDEFYLARKIAHPKTVEEFVNLFKANDLKAPHVRFMHTIFERRSADIERAVEGKDKDLNEGYSNFAKSELKKFNQFYKNLLGACTMMQEAAKVERAPRKKKPISQEKLVSKLKYKKEDTSLGIVSVNPSQIIGATVVWCFDTKTRKLIKYVADDLLGTLSVKGASIICINQVKSMSKTLRKPAEQLAAFKKCSKIQLRTFMEEITTVGISPSGKINENCIILRIDK
jgi:hypothetical protein